MAANVALVAVGFVVPAMAMMFAVLGWRLTAIERKLDAALAEAERQRNTRFVSWEELDDTLKRTPSPRSTAGSTTTRCHRLR